MPHAQRTYRSREEWLRARRIGSSDVPLILGLSRYGTGYDVWDRLVFGVRPEPLSADQDRGIRLEPRVLATYAQRTGRPVTATPPHTLYAREEWSTSTPDARSDELLVEVKTDRLAHRWGPETEIDRWDAGAEKHVRPDYYLQVQHQLWTCEAPAADLAVLLPGEDPFLPELRVYRLHRDDELLGRLTDRLRGWWQRHVVAQVPPELDDSAAAARALAQVERSGSRRASRDEERLAALYAELAEREKQAQEAKRTAGRQLVQLAGEAQRLELAAGHVTIVQGTSHEQLDERALLADHPELVEVLARYRREGTEYAYPRVTARKERK
jgi:predicted phage-related endonuclease